MTQAVFLAAMMLGVLLLIAGLGVTRLNWRRDIAPFSRKTRFIDVCLHTEKYAQPEVVPRVRVLNTLGLLFLVIAAAALLREALSQFLR